MSARLLMLCVAFLLVGCGSDESADDDGASQSVQLVGGQAVCDSCASVRIVLSGPGIVNVDDAMFVTSDMARTTVAARIALSREPGTSGEVLVVTAYFDRGIAAGDFDLWLDPVTAGDAARVVPAALRVTRARPGPGDLATLRVWIQVTGTDRDGRFLLHTVAGCQTDACGPIDVEAYGSKSLLLAPGTYTFQLDGVANNCTTTAGSSPATLKLERGKVTALSYTLSCSQVAVPGWVRVANVTAGPDQDNEYLVSCSPFACLPFKLAANRDTVLRLVPGDLTIRIGDVAPHCTVTGSLEVSATAAVGDTSDVGFAIACSARPGLRVTVHASGRDIDPGFRVTTCTSYYGSCWSLLASSGAAVTFLEVPMPSAQYVYLDDVAENCVVSAPDYRLVELRDSTVDTSFEVICRAYGTVRVIVATTGTNQDASYRLVRPARCESYYYDCEQYTLPSSGAIDVRAAPGEQSFELMDVASNCSVLSDILRVTAVEDAVVELRFEVACQ